MCKLNADNETTEAFNRHTVNCIRGTNGIKFSCLLDSYIKLIRIFFLNGQINFLQQNDNAKADPHQIINLAVFCSK